AYMHRLAADLGVSDTYHRTQVGVWFGEAGTRVPDPYFGGEGPDKFACTGCGACMTGCRVGAKNTLDRNYLYLAERNGAVVHPDTQVVDLEAREDGGWLVHTDRSGAVLRHRRRTFVARDVVLSAGGLGPLQLVLRREEGGAAPHLAA